MAFGEIQRWRAPHPPGSNLNIHPETVAEVLDDRKLRINFPEPVGLVLGKMRGMHIPSTRFLGGDRLRLQEAGHRGRPQLELRPESLPAQTPHIYVLEQSR